MHLVSFFNVPLAIFGTHLVLFIFPKFSSMALRDFLNVMKLLIFSIYEAHLLSYELFIHYVFSSTGQPSQSIPILQMKELRF